MRFVELRRHTDNNGDVLSEEGVRAALEIGSGLVGGYDLVVSSGAQRATQTAACFLAAFTMRVPGGVVIDDGFRSEDEDMWRELATAGNGRFSGMLEANRSFVEAEAARFGSAVRRVAGGLREGGRALVVGHSPMHEAAVYGLTGAPIDPLKKGAGVIVVFDGERVRTESSR